MVEEIHTYHYLEWLKKKTKKTKTPFGGERFMPKLEDLTDFKGLTNQHLNR